MYGFLFVKIFYFTIGHEEHHGTESILLFSLVVGCIISNVIKIIPISVSVAIDTLGICVISVVLGYLFGRIYVSDFLNNLLYKLRMPTDTKEDMIETLTDYNYPMYLAIETDDDKIYHGYYFTADKCGDHFNIVLTAYHVTYPDGHIDNHEGDTRSVVWLNTSKVKSVTFKYYNQSKKVNDIKDFIENHTIEGSPTYRDIF